MKLDAFNDHIAEHITQGVDVLHRGQDEPAPFPLLMGRVMSALDGSTITDAEATEKLGFPVHIIRRVLYENALCLRAGGP